MYYNTRYSIVSGIYTMAINDLITFRKGTFPEWSGVNPVLASGEPGYDLTNRTLKIGDGVSNWVSLSGHNHISSEITNFNSSVSGLLSVKDITAGYDIAVTNTSGIYSISSTNFIHVDDKQPHGFVDRTSNLISMSGNTFTIAPTGSSYDIYSLGTRYTKTSGESISLPNTNGTYYIHFNTDTLALDYKTTAFNFDSDVPVAYVYWNTTQGSGIFFADERHGIQMDRSTHRYLHNVFGTQYINGLSISNYILDGDGSLNSHASIAISDGVIYDEDIIINITNSANPSPLSSFEQVLSPTGQFPVYYRSGVGGAWSSTNNSSYPLKFGTTAQYNLNTAGTWTTPNTANSKFVASWLCATNQIHSPVIAIMGQMFSSNITQAESDNAWGSLDLGGLPIVEFRPLYRLIYETSTAYTNAVKSRLMSILDLRSQLNTVEGVTSNDHGSLYGLADDDHAQYVHIDNARTISANHTFSNGLTSNGLISSSSGNFTGSLQVNGTGVSISGHTHTSSGISDSTSAGRALLTGADSSAQRTSLGLGTIATQASGNYALVSHSHTSSNITDFGTSVSDLLPVKNIIAGTNITVSSSSGLFTINSTASGGGSSSIDGGIYPLITISSQPSGTTVAASSNATFSVTASASSPTSSISYQWQESTNNSVWTDISGSTSSTLTLTSVQSDKNGYYYRSNLQSLLSNIYSNSAILTVTAALTPTPTSSTIPASPTPTVTPTTTSAAVTPVTYAGRFGQSGASHTITGTNTVTAVLSGNTSFTSADTRLWLVINKTGTLTYTVTASSEADYDGGRLYLSTSAPAQHTVPSQEAYNATISGLTNVSNGVSGTSSSSGTVAVTAGQWLVLRYTTDSGETGGTDSITAVLSISEAPTPTPTPTLTPTPTATPSGPLLTIARDNGSSTFTGSGTVGSPFTRAAGHNLGDTDGLSHYTWTVSASATVTLVFNYTDGDSAGEQYYINRTRSGSTVTQAQGTDGTAITVNVSVISGDVISFSSSGYPPAQLFSNVSVSAA